MSQFPKKIRNYFNKPTRKNIVTIFLEDNQTLLFQQVTFRNTKTMNTGSKKQTFHGQELLEVFNKSYIDVIGKSVGPKQTNICKNIIKITANMKYVSYVTILDFKKIKGVNKSKGNINDYTTFLPVNTNEVKNMSPKV